MKRPLLILIALVFTVPAFAITGSSTPASGSRIGVLRMSERYSYGAEQTIATTVQTELRNELRARGFEAFDAQTTLDELSRGKAENADYYVEIVSSRGANDQYGSVDVAAGAIGAELSIVTSRVAAEVRLYDGKSLELVDSFDLHDDRTALLPTSVGVGGRHVFAAIAIPFVQYAQYRRAARVVARHAATLIAGQ